MGRSSLRVFGSTCPHTSKMDFPAIIQIKLSCNTDLFKSYNTGLSKTQELWPTWGASMSVTPNFCCDETKNRGAYTHLTLPRQGAWVQFPGLGTKILHAVRPTKVKRTETKITTKSLWVQIASSQNQQYLIIVWANSSILPYYWFYLQLTICNWLQVWKEG